MRSGGGTTATGPSRPTSTGSSDSSIFPASAIREDLGAAEVTAFLNYLARDRDVAASTQNQALAALLFLYKEALEHAAAVA